MKKTKGKRSVWWRRSVQLFFFLLIAILVTGNQLHESGIAVPSLLEGASIHALCPFGGVVSFWQFISAGTLVKKIHNSSMVLMGLVLLLTIVFGPVLCGWICPLGSIQEWLGLAGKKLFRKKYNKIIPSKIDRWLRYLRYIVLIWVSWVTITSGTLIFQTYDPYNALFTFWSEEASITGIIILLVVLILSLVVERPFCKYACPYGAFQGLFNLFRIFPVKRNASTCINCSACDRACPMNIKVSMAASVRNHQCISCFECSSERVCPVADTVVTGVESMAKKSLKIKIPAVTIIIVIVTFGGIGFSKLTGWWLTESSKQPAKFTSGEFAGQANPADIRGSYTWQDIENAFGIPSTELVEAFSWHTADMTADTKINILETVFAEIVPEGKEIGTDSVRLFTALYLGIPYTPEEGTALPPKAAAALQKKGIAVEAFRVQLMETGEDSAAAQPAEHIAQTENENSITGKTTIGELLQNGISEEKLKELLKLERLSSGETLKDAATRQGLSFSTLKETLEPLMADND